MSRVKQMADADADAVEREDADRADETTEPESETPEPAAAEDEHGDPDPTAALGSVVQSYVDGVQKVMGDDFEAVHVCPFCTSFVPGFTFEPLIGPPEYADDPDVERCAKCNGWGVLATGARHEGSKTRPCTDCSGNGYRTKAVPLAQAVSAPAQTQPMPPDVVQALRDAGYVVVPPTPLTYPQG